MGKCSSSYAVNTATGEVYRAASFYCLMIPDTFDQWAAAGAEIIDCRKNVASACLAPTAVELE